MKLAGTTFIRNGVKFDYCFVETILCLLEFCDHVFVVDAGSEDDTVEMIEGIHFPNLTLIKMTKEDWDERQGTGSNKLCYFTDIAIKAAQDAGYDYQFYLQCDEIVHEKSYDEIRKAIETGAEAYMCSRINLWQSPYLQLDVPQERKPCNTQIIRLTKTKYRSIDDAENIGVPYVDSYFQNGIRIYHMGFVRKRELMKSKIINMQVGVFEMSDYDNKLKEAEVFNPKLWFDGEDLKPIDEPLPKIIQKWAKERYYE